MYLNENDNPGANSQADPLLRALPAGWAELRRPEGPGLGVPLRCWFPDAEQLLAGCFAPHL